MVNKNMKQILLVLTLSTLMAVMSFTNPKLVVDDAPNSGGTSARSITPTYIEMWSESSTLNPQIPFEDCILSDIVVDSAGNTYVSGTFTSQIGFGNITLNTFTDDYSIFIAKLSPSASWDWAIQSTGDNAHSRAMTLDIYESKLYVVGNFVGNNSFGSHVASSVEKNMFVSSIDADTGEFKDIYTPSSSGISNAEAVIARTGGGVYVTGEYEVGLNLPGVPSLPLSNGHTNAFVASLSEQGWEWSTSTNCHLSVCGDENATSLTLDHNGNVAVLGIMAANTTFGAIGAAGSGPALLGAGFTDVFVWVINSVNASPINAISTDGIGIEIPAKIVTLGEELIVSGNFVGAMNLSGINVLSYTGTTFSTGFVSSLTINEQQVNWNWVRTVNGSSDSGPTHGRFTLVELAFIPWQITDIDIGLNNTIIVGGEYWGAAQLDGLIMPGTGSITNLDAFVAQLSHQGDWLNMLIVGGPGPDGMTRVATSSNGQVYMGLDSDSVAITFGDSTHYPSDRSVIVGSFDWDRDKDSVSDYNDQCEGHDDRIDEDNDATPDGCDSLIDSDGDSIPDTSDHCPYIPGIPEYNGCPEPTLVGCTDLAAENYSSLANTNSTTCEYDTDGDGIYDSVDYCDNEPEDFDGWEDGDGCPDIDNDEDLINDVDDACPNVHATADGNVDENGDGCPDFCDLECDDGIGDPEGDTTPLDSSWDITDCRFENNSMNNCEEEVTIAGGAGVGLIGGSVITRWIRPKTKGGKPKLDLGRVGDAKDAYDLISREKPGKKIKTTGGSDHYFKPGVERQGAMSTAADTALDDYVEDDS
ncbi:MAG: thrombospondin type 3 repeat-containing protein [Anaerolineales bacterium]|nr:thrombospondin type 3 repeat-containing protein [Anaerolineales bacterium]